MHATYHVLARCNQRECIFRDDRDREEFLRRLETICGKNGWLIRAFVLMDNHYHLVIHTPEPNLVAGMKWFQNAYTRYFNSRHRLWGRLFGDRYKSILVEEERSFGGRGTACGDYLTTLIDYIHLNPARAGLIYPRRGESLCDYPWSSLTRGYLLPPSKRAEWLDAATGLALAQCRDTAAGRKEYLERLDRRVREEKAKRLGLDGGEIEGQSFRSNLRRGWYWGSESFRDWVKDKLSPAATGNRTYRSSRPGKTRTADEAERILARGREWFGIEATEDLSEPKRGDLRRVAIAWAIWRRTGMSQSGIAACLGLRSAPNVSQWIRRFEAMPETELPVKIRKWKRNLSKILD